MVEGALNEEETKAAQEKTKAKLEDRSAQLRREVARFSYEYVLYELKSGFGRVASLGACKLAPICFIF